MSAVVTILIVALVASLARAVDDSDLDQFTYSTEGSTEPNQQWPPSEWKYVRCNNLEECVGWPEKFEAAVDWKLTTNDCDWCPADGSGNCDMHHQSPINLERNTALNETETYHDCIDVHKMKYYDSTCSFDQLVEYDAFTVQRHALQIRQPMEEYEPNMYQVACAQGQSQTKRWGRIDFSRGYPNWWFLSHIDFHVPSEHTQEGKRFDAEMQMYHFYSVDASVSGFDNEMATVAIFLQVYEDNPKDYYMLNKLICQWRRYEEETRNQCGLPSVDTPFLGCTKYNRTKGSAFNETTTDDFTTNETTIGGTNRNLYEEWNQRSRAWTAQDLMIHNHRQARTNTSYTPAIIRLADHDFEEPDFDWKEMVEEVYRNDEEMSQGRHLMDYESVGPFHNYFGMNAVKTEYYYKYSGAQTIPPCYGSYIKGTRKQTNHWRIMKDPIKVTQRQIDEMHRLLKERIAPYDDPIRPCQPDTAGGTYKGDETKVNVSRPLMETTEVHYQTFCECQDWKSEWLEDQAWCELDQLDRYYEQPYNFASNGF